MLVGIVPGDKGRRRVKREKGGRREEGWRGGEGRKERKGRTHVSVAEFSEVFEEGFEEAVDVCGCEGHADVHRC